MCPSTRGVGCLLVVLLLGVSPLGGADMRRRKKLIATGWDKADTKRLRENRAQMERRPFDGVVLTAVGRGEDGKRRLLRWAFRRGKWQRAWFQPCIDDLKACTFRRFTDNFVQFNANPGDVDWFDDAGWADIVEHWRIAAWVARQSGCKGMLFDPEPYTKPHAPFWYGAQPGRRRHTFNEYYAQARRRGREVMAAVVKEFPDITLFCYFMNSVVSQATGHADPRRVLQTLRYGLYPAFIDGWLDVAPPAVTFVDGCEHAYRFNSANQYLEAGTAIKGACQELVSPANRAKYRAQVQVSFGVYLDAYWNPKSSPWYVDGLGRPRVERLGENVRTALRVADEYVWVYGEKFRWWPTPNQRVKDETWPQALPGCEKMLALARNPVEFARERIAAAGKAGTLTNRVSNGDFASDKADHDGQTEVWKQGRPPAGWHAWQEKTSKGTFAWDREEGAAGKGSARAAGVANGCFLQRVPAKPGETYVVWAVTRTKGAGRTWIRVRWQTPESKWTAVTLDRLLLPAKPGGGWAEIFGVVEVPAGAGKLVVLLGVGGQQAPKDAAWFDDVRVYRVDQPAHCVTKGTKTTKITKPLRERSCICGAWRVWARSTQTAAANAVGRSP